MPIIIEEKKEQSVKKTLCNFKVTRVIGGLKIYAKSDVYEDFFVKISDGKVANNENPYFGSGHKYYDCKRVSVPRAEYTKSINVQNYCYQNVVTEGSSTYDFSFIRTVGIKNGLEIECKGMFLQEDVEAMVKDFTLFTKNFFSNYAKKFSMEVNIVSII